MKTTYFQCQKRAHVRRNSLHTYFTVAYLTDDLDVDLHWGLRLLMSMFGSGCLVTISFN